MSQPCTLRDDDQLDIAIIGGGIAGLSLALGLVTRNINFRVYERASGFREIGAGIGFTPNAEWAMKAIDPQIHAAFKKVATPNTSDWFHWVDGHSEKGDDARLTEDDYIFKLYLGERGFEGCHRADFLDELVKLIPTEKIEFQKHLSQIVDRGDGEKLLLKFHDGTEAQVDLGTVDIGPFLWRHIKTDCQSKKLSAVMAFTLESANWYWAKTIQHRTLTTATNTLSEV